MKNRIKDLRDDHDMTQQQVADILHISRSYVSRLEKHALARLRRAWNQPHPL